MPNMGVDPDGQAVHVLVGSAIGGVINLAGEAIKGNVHNFKHGLLSFGMGAISGALAVATGGSSLTYGQLALQAAVSQIPGANINLVGGFSLSLNPAIAFGTNQFSLDLNVGASYSSEHFSAGVILTGLYNGNSIGTGGKSWDGRVGYGIQIGSNSGFHVGLSSTRFATTNGTSQQTGSIGIGYGDFNATYENDHMFALNPLMADGGDRFRTTGARVSYRDLSIGINLFTGDPGDLTKSERAKHLMEGQLIRTYKEQTAQYRLGAAYVGYKNIRVGGNSERVRKFFQNDLAHGNEKIPIFQVLNNNVNPYFQYGTRYRYTTW
jgi:hypothetical protein